jgi:hypothetical protein
MTFRRSIYISYAEVVSTGQEWIVGGVHCLCHTHLPAVNIASITFRNVYTSYTETVPKWRNNCLSYIVHEFEFLRPKNEMSRACDPDK